MAQQVITKYTDDLDGSDAAGSVEFALDGRAYEIDLNDQNAARLRDVLAPFVAAARRAGGRGHQPSAARPRRIELSGPQPRDDADAHLTARARPPDLRPRTHPQRFVQAWETRTPADTDTAQPATTGNPNGHAVEVQSA